MSFRTECRSSFKPGSYTELFTVSILTIPQKYKEIYILCTIADHYPALSFQARQFLKCKKTKNIMHPFVMDIFLLDVMCEMFSSPLYFLSYLNRRVLYFNKVLAMHELTVLSYHLKQNLYIDDKFDMFQLGDDISVDLDVAMTVRREGIPGNPTPSGILTKTVGTRVGNLIHEIEEIEHHGIIDLGFMLLFLNEETITDISNGIEMITNKANLDGKSHDITVGIGVDSTGLTIHCNDIKDEIAREKLSRHCELRKYSQKANTWFGLCIHPKNGKLRFGLGHEYKWEKSAELDKLVKGLPKGKQKIENIYERDKIGRNDLCPCGSEKKYKKCCLKK